MSNTTQTVVADAIVEQFALSSEQSESIAVAAEMVMDATYDFRKACDAVAGVFKAIKDQGFLTFTAWEVVRKRFELVAEARARDNGAIDPAGAANDQWGEVTKFMRTIHGLQKPKAENKDAQRMAEKREADAKKAIEVAAGRSADELEKTKRELYAQATDEAIAQAKALEKVIKAVTKVEKDSVSIQMKPLMESAQGHHKAIMEFMKSKNDPKLMGDYVVLLKRTLEIWKEAK
jgi:hypothetical protein